MSYGRQTYEFRKVLLKEGTCVTEALLENVDDHSVIDLGCLYAPNTGRCSSRQRMGITFDSMFVHLRSKKGLRKERKERLAESILPLELKLAAVSAIPARGRN